MGRRNDLKLTSNESEDHSTKMGQHTSGNAEKAACSASILGLPVQIVEE